MNSSTLTLQFGRVHFLYKGSLLLSCFVEISKLNANSVDPDQISHSVASDLGLHCLPMSLLWDARLKWVKYLTHATCLNMHAYNRKLK